MNPGPMEESVKVASTFIDVMRSQPLAMALAVCNLVLLGLFFYVAQWAGNNRADEFKAIMLMQKETQQLLYNCTPNRPNG